MIWVEDNGRSVREGVEDQLILEKAKGEEGLTREQIESRIVVPHHTIFLQFFSLYILPGIHKFQQRNQCRDQCRYKNHPTQNPFQNSNASSLLIRHEFSLIKTRRFT